MRILGFAVFLVFCGEAIALAQTASRAPCNAAQNQCVTRAHSSTTNRSNATTYRTQYYPYQRYSITTGRYGIYNTQYYPYANSSTTITPYGSYTTRYFPSQSGSTNQPIVNEQHCSFNASLQTVQCY
jgi:hypothetical protein